MASVLPATTQPRLLTDLPTEVLSKIVDNIDDYPSVDSLRSTCTTFRDLLPATDNFSKKTRERTREQEWKQLCRIVVEISSSLHDAKADAAYWDALSELEQDEWLLRQSNAIVELEYHAQQANIDLYITYDDIVEALEEFFTTSSEDSSASCDPLRGLPALDRVLFKEMKSPDDRKRSVFAAMKARMFDSRDLQPLKEKLKKRRQQQPEHNGVWRPREYDLSPYDPYLS